MSTQRGAGKRAYILTVPVRPARRQDTCARDPADGDFATPAIP